MAIVGSRDEQRVGTLEDPVEPDHPRIRSQPVELFLAEGRRRASAAAGEQHRRNGDDGQPRWGSYHGRSSPDIGGRPAFRPANLRLFTAESSVEWWGFRVRAVSYPLDRGRKGFLMAISSAPERTRGAGRRR